MEQRAIYHSPIYLIAKDLLVGSAGGAAQVLAGQPFDIVKVRMQRNPTLSMNEWIKNIIFNEGSKAFYKGTLSPLAGIAAWTSILYGTNEYSKRFWQDYNREHGYSNPNLLSVSQLILWGMCAGAANAVVVSPVEHIRIVMQVQTNKSGSKGEFTGSYDAFKKIYITASLLTDLSLSKKMMYQKYGLKGVYKGYTITLMRCSISWGAWFGWYESLKQLLLSYNPNPSIIWFMILGAISGEWYWLSSYPVDVCKTKIQSDSFETPKYKGIIDVFSKTYKAEGIRGFWRGILPWMMRTPITSGWTFAMFEISKKLMASSQ